MLWALLALVALAGLIAILAGDGGTLFGLDAGLLVPLLTGVALLIFIGGSVVSGYRGRIGQGLRDLAVWVAIAFALVLAYSYRDVFTGAAHRVMGELMPPGETLAVAGQPGDRAVRLRRRPDGHFVARAAVNGANASLLVDTGATTVVLTPNDAKAAGFDPQKLSYAVPVRTANGLAYAASVRLRSVAVGGVTVENVDALVAAPGALSQSLLGMSFLTRLRSYEVSGEFMTLRI